jgi:hypothetical protein
MGGALLGLLVSPAGPALRADPDRAVRLRDAAGPDVPCIAVYREEDLGAAARALVAAGCRAVGVDGDDHFVGAAAGALLAAVGPDERVPPILHLHGGRMNAVARALELRRAPPEELLRVARTLLSRPDELPVAVRSCLRVNGRSCFFGAAVSFMGFDAALEVEGTALPVQRYRWLMWGTVASPLGLDWVPLLFRAAEVPGAFHLVGDAGEPVAILRAAARVLRGRPVAREGYLSHLARRATLRAARPVRFLLDGTMQEPTELLALESGPPIAFLRAEP